MASIRDFFRRGDKKELIHKPKKSLDKILNETLVNEVSRDPNIKRRLAFKQAGYEDVLKEENPFEQTKRDVQAEVGRSCVELVKTDPELRDR